MKKLIILTFLMALLVTNKVSGQCTWTIEWGLDCPSGPVYITGCGQTSSITSFCNPAPPPTDCGCATSGIYGSHTVNLPAALCSCNPLAVSVNGVTYNDGDKFCCPGQPPLSPSNPCGTSCACVQVEIDYTNLVVKFRKITGCP
jgi:hypothetical protein